MKKINYKVTITTTDKTMKIAFFGKLPGSLALTKIRMQAVFTQNGIDRRIPMEVSCNREDDDIMMISIAKVELPYIYFTSPEAEAELSFSLWYGTQEIILKGDSFKVDAASMKRPRIIQKKSDVAFAGYSFAMPFMLARNYFKGGRNMDKAKHEVNKQIYEKTGRGYSPRQNNTDYFAEYYNLIAEENLQEIAMTDTSMEPGQQTILFLSERRPEAEGNLMLMKKMFEQDPTVHVTEFINTKTVDRLSKEELRECAEKCAKANVIILEDFYPQLHKLQLRKETKVVQLWHACGAFKTFGFSRMGLPGGVEQSSLNHRNYDLCCVSSEAIRGIYAEAFAIPTKNVLPLGVPRTDMLCHEGYKQSKRNELYESYPQLQGKKVIMFAPTFRGDGNKDAYYPMEEFDVNAFMAKMPENTALIIKHHPFVKETMPVDEKWQNRVLDLSKGENINSLLLVTDLLITDYSSCIFESTMLDVPSVHYVFDEREYMDSRDFYFSLDRIAVGPITHHFDKLISIVRRYMEKGDKAAIMPEAKVERFKKTFLDSIDGGSIQRIYEYIKENLLDNEDAYWDYKEQEAAAYEEEYDQQYEYEGEYEGEYDEYEDGEYDDYEEYEDGEYDDYEDEYVEEYEEEPVTLQTEDASMAQAEPVSAEEEEYDDAYDDEYYED